MQYSQMFTQEQVKTCLLVLPVATVFLSIGICDHMVLSVSQTGTSTVSSCYLPPTSVCSACN